VTTAPSTWAIRVPASSANLGAGFDVLGMALSLYAEVGIGPAPSGATPADRHHPATVAFHRLGGEGEVWVRSPIPMGRGLGFSGAVRVGGAAAAIVQREGSAAMEADAMREEILAVAGELEGHADNAAASLHGGIVVVADGRAIGVPLAFDPAVVVWIPTDTATSTDRSRASLPLMVARDDAVFNLGRVGTFVAACARGDAAALRVATEDRLHQAVRLAMVPETARALQAGLDADVWAAWLSGSGPTVAMLCESSRAEEVAAALPETGHTKSLRIDHEGAVAIELGPDGVNDSGGEIDTGVESAATD
jgi:homoserine kinase